MVRTGCIPAGLILKGIYGSTSVIGDCSLFQIIGRFYTMKKEFGDCTRRLSLCFLFSNSAGGFSKSISFCRTYSPKKKTFFIQKILIQINDITLFHLLNYNNRGRSSKKLKLIIKKIRSFPLSFVFFFSFAISRWKIAHMTRRMENWRNNCRSNARIKREREREKERDESHHCKKEALKT